MSSHAAFLRGVNLGKRRRVPNAALQECLEGLGLGDVACFRSSGNVVFDSGGAGEAELRERIEAGLADAFGFEIEVVLREADRVRAIADHEPFDAALVDAAKGKLQVILGARPLDGPARRLASELADEVDRLEVFADELYWLPMAGIQGSRLDQTALGRAFGPITVRTKGTVEQIASKYFG